MAKMPFALVRLMADYARADEIDYGDIFVYSNDTLFFFRLPDVDRETKEDILRFADANDWREKYSINMKFAKYGEFSTIKIITKDVLLRPCSCRQCGCEKVADDSTQYPTFFIQNYVVCENCGYNCMCRDCEEFLDECSCKSEVDEGE